MVTGRKFPDSESSIGAVLSQSPKAAEISPEHTKMFSLGETGASRWEEQNIPLKRIVKVGISRALLFPSIDSGDLRGKLCRRLRRPGLRLPTAHRDFRYNQITRMVRRDGRVAEGARLESVFRGNSNVGSNPTLSARNNQGPSPRERAQDFGSRLRRREIASSSNPTLSASRLSPHRQLPPENTRQRTLRKSKQRFSCPLDAAFPPGNVVTTVTCFGYLR